MNIEKLQQLPEEVKDIIFTDEFGVILQKIISDFSLRQDDGKRLINLLVSVYTREVNVLDFPAALAKLNIPNIDIRALTLECALKQLWPLQQYLGDVDRLILRLGGVVPASVPPLGSPRTTDEIEIPDQDSRITMPIRDYLDQDGTRRDLWLTKDFIHDEAGRVIEPSITNWLKDYLHFAGADGLDNLIRSQYLVRSVNAKQLPEAEKANLLNFLDSYNEGRPMRLEVRDNILTLAEVGEAPPKVVLDQAVSLDQILQRYHQYVDKLQLQLDRLKDGLLVESGNEVGRLADLLWNAIGLSERERALVALILLAERQHVPELIRTDQRYIGILRRYVNVRFGDRAKSFWQPEWTAVNSTLLFQLLLEDKIHLDQSESVMAAEYLGQIMKLTEPPVYVDLAIGRFRWRTVEYTDKKFILI
jgi:hypothetical protein